MADSVNVGRAFFQFALDAGEAVQGLVDLNTQVTSTVGKVNANFAKMSESSGHVSDRMGEMLRSTERFTRGLRGVSAEMARNQEQVYRYEDQQERMGNAMELAKNALARATQNLQKNTQAQAHARAQLNLLAGDMLKYETGIKRQEQALDALRQSRTVDTEEVNKAQIKLDATTARHQKLIDVITREEAVVQKMRHESAQYNLQLQEQAADIDRARTRHDYLNATLIDEKNTLNALLETQKNFPAVYRSMEERLKTMEQQRTSTIAGYKNEEAALKELQERARHFKREQNEADDKIMAAGANRRRLEALQMQAEQRLHDMRVANRGANVKFDAAQLNAQQALLDGLKAQVTIARRNYQLETEAKEKLIREQQNYTNVLAAQQARIDSLRQAERQLTADIAKHSGEMGVALARHNAMPDKINEQVAKMDDMRARLKQLNIEIKTQTEAYDGLQHQQAVHAATMQRNISEIDRLKAKEREVMLVIDERQRRLAQAQGGRTDDAAIKAQEAELKKLQAAYVATQKEIQKYEAEVTNLAESHEKLALQEERAKLNIVDQEHAQTRLNSLLAIAQEKLDGAAEKAQQFAGRTRNAANATNDAAAAQQSWLSRLINFLNVGQHASNKIRDIGAKADATSEKVTRLSLAFNDVMVGIVTVGLGNVLGEAILGLQGMAATGLEAYRAQERLEFSLTALMEREIKAKDATLSLAEAKQLAAEKAQGLIVWIDQLAIKSPFSNENIRAAYQLGMNMGFTSDQAQRLTQATVDYAAANGLTGEAIESAVRAMGQMHAKGKVSLEEIGQLEEAGIGVRDVLRNQFAPAIEASGKSLEDLISAGVIPADEAIAAIVKQFETDFPNAAANSSASMDGVLASIDDLQRSGLRQFFTRTFEVVQPLLEKFAAFLSDPNTIGSIQAFGYMLGERVGAIMNWLADNVLPKLIAAVQWLAPVLMEGLGMIGVVAQQAWEWGYEIGAQLAGGLGETVSMVMEVVNYIGEAIAYWLEPHSPPKILPEIDQWGAAVGKMYISSMADQENLDLLKQFGQEVQTIASDMLTGNMAEQDIIPTVLKTREAFSLALTELRALGSVSESSFARIRNAAGPVGEQVEAYARSFMKVTAAQQKLTAAQRELNRVTSVYDQQIDALKAKLEGENKKGEIADLDKQIAAMEQLQGANNPAGMGVDQDQVSRELNRLRTERQIAQLELERADAVAGASSAVDAAQEEYNIAREQFELQQAVVEATREQNDLVQKQIDLLQRLADEAEKERVREERTLAQGDAAALQQEREAARLAEAQRRAAMAGMTTEEQIAAVREEMANTAEGTVEYAKLQEELTKLEKKRAVELGKLSEAEFDQQMAMADTASQVDLLEAKLASLAPGTVEYARTQRELTIAQERLAKEQAKGVEAAAKLSDEEFDAALASKDRAGQIDLLRERLEGLEPGTKRYLDTLTKLNRLERQNLTGGGGGGRGIGGLGKPGALGGSPFEGNPTLANLPKTVDAIAKPMEEISRNIDGVTKKVDGFKQSILPFFDVLKENAEIVTFFIQKVITNIALALVISKVIKPLGQIVTWLRGFITVSNAVGLAIGLLAFSWKNNIGGIRDIMLGAWQQVAPVFDGMMQRINIIIDAFTNGGIEAGFRAFMGNIAGIGQSLGEIGSTLGGAFAIWAQDMIDPIVTMFRDAFDGAVTRIEQIGFGEYIQEIAQQLFGGEGTGAADTVLVGMMSFVVGGLEMMFTTIVTWIALHGSGVGEQLMLLIEELGNRLIRGIQDLATAASFVLPALIMAAVEAIVPMISTVLNTLIDIAGWLLPKLPSLVGSAVTALLALVTYILARGLPLLFGLIMNVGGHLIETVAKILPELGMNLGKLVGSTITKIILAALSLVGFILANLPQTMVALFTWITNDLPRILQTVGVGILGGILNFFMGIVVGLFEPFVDAMRLVLMAADTGMRDWLNENYTGISDAIGGFFVGILEGIKTLLTLFGKNDMAQLAQGIIDGLKAGMEGGFVGFMQAIVTMFTGFVDWCINFFQIASPSKLFTGFGEFIIQGFWDGIQSTWDSFYSWFTSTVELWANFIDVTLNVIIAVATALWTIFVATSKNLWETLVRNITTAIITLANTVRTWATTIVTWIMEQFNTLSSRASSAFNSAKSAILTVLSETQSSAVAKAIEIVGVIDSEIRKLPGRIADGIRNIKDKFNYAFEEVRAIFTSTRPGSLIMNLMNDAQNLGDRIVDGMIKGLRDGWDRLVQTLRELASHLPQPVQDVLGIESPSRVFAETVGAPIVDGIAAGILGSAENADRALASVTDGLAGGDLSRSGLGLIDFIDSRLRMLESRVDTGFLRGEGMQREIAERHDHWHMTVNTQAREASVIEDYNIMRSMAGAGG